MDFLKYLFRYKNLWNLFHLFVFFLLIHSFANKTYDLDSFEKARAIFSRPPNAYGNVNSRQVWELADREISFLRSSGNLPEIYSIRGGRDMFISVEILQACERLLSRIEMDSYTPVSIDSDSIITGTVFKQNTLDLGMRIAREIQYCFLQYGSEILQIPALERYSEILKSWGVQRIFTDKEAKHSLDLLAKNMKVSDNEYTQDKELRLIKLSSALGSGDLDKYLILDPRRKQPEKRKLVTIQPKMNKVTMKEPKSKPIEQEVIKSNRRIIARPNKTTRHAIHDLALHNTVSNRLKELNNHPLASKKSAGINILQLIKQDNISDKIKSLGPEAQLILAWQSVVEAKDQFNEESDYYVRDLPDTISSTLIYQSCPNFSLLNFQKSCLEIIMYRNSQIEKGFIEGEQTSFYLKDGDSLIVSKHVINTAAMQLCAIAQEFYLPNIIENSEDYIERLNLLQSQKEKEEETQIFDVSVEIPGKSQDAKSRLYESYKKLMMKKGAMILLNTKDPIWEELEHCNSGECVNEIIYRDLSYWLISPENLLNLIFQTSVENYVDSLIITDYSQPTDMKIGNIFDTSGSTVFKFCSTYLKNLVLKGKADLVLGGIYTNLDHVIEELCKEITLELSKNESFLMDKRLLIGTLYELELIFCNILGVPPKGRSTDLSNIRTEFEALSSGPINIGRDIWALEECGSILDFQLNYLLCLGSFAQGFIANLFPNSKESVIPITLLCKAFIKLEKDQKNPYDPLEMGTYLSNILFEQKLYGNFPFASDNDKNSKKNTTSFFIELCSQFKMNHDKNFYTESDNIIDAIESIHLSRLCSAPLFAFLPFDLVIYPINKDLIDSLVPYGLRINFNTNISPGNIQPCIGIQTHIINYLHVLAAIIESFTINYIDLDKIGTSDVDIKVNFLCLWWKHPIKNPLNNVLGNLLPFMVNKEVADYVLRYSLMTESVNFPAPVRAEKRIEYIYSTKQILSNRAKDLPKELILPSFNPPLNVFNELEYYLRKHVIIEYKQLGNIIDEDNLGELNFEFISKKCPDLVNWQIYFAISFQNSVTIILKMILSKLNFKTQFIIPIEILCNWIINTFPTDFKDKQFINSSDAGKSLELESKKSLFWLQSSMGEYLVSTFNIWSQTAFALKLGGVNRNRKLDPNKIIMSEIKYLFDQKIQSVIDTSENPKILSLKKVDILTRLRLNPFIDESLRLQNPKLESECDAPWVVNLMNAFRIYFMEFQRKYIDPLFQNEFDPFVMCEIIKEIVKNEVFQSGFGESFFKIFKDQKWVNNKQLVRILVKNATNWILETFELPGYPTYDTLQYKNENLLECYKLRFCMENRPIHSSLRYGIEDIQVNLLPKIEVTSFPTLSLKSITPFLRSLDPNTYYKDTQYCTNLSDSEIRMLVSLSSYLETVSKNIFISRVPSDSKKKGILEELQYEFPMEVICRWWSLVKKSVDPNYSSKKNCWASILSSRILEFHHEQVRINQEMNMPWKVWFTDAVAEALLSGFFSSVNRNTVNNDYRVESETLTSEGFINQSIIRDPQLLEILFSSNSNYIYTTPFHRSTTDLTNLPLSYFSYFHLPAINYLSVNDILQSEYRRPIDHPEIMVGRTLHQIEINKCIHIAYVINKFSKLATSNNWRISINNLTELFMKYKSTNLGLIKWLEHLRKAIPNTNVSIRAIFIVYLSYLREEARIIKLNNSDFDIRSNARSQIDGFYSLPLHNSLTFTSEPLAGFFPLFEINDQREFSEVKIPGMNTIVPAPKMSFTRFQGRYWRSKICCFKANENFLDDIEKIVPSIWPSLGIISETKKFTDMDKNEIISQINSESKVISKYNCNGLSVWQVNRATYWAGMLQRYINKGPRLLRENKEMIKEIRNYWNIKVKFRKFPKIFGKNKNNDSFNIFDMCFFYKAINFFYNDIREDFNYSNKSIQNSWEEDHERMPFYLVYLFKNLFIDYYQNLNYSHIVIFFYELLLEEKRIMKLKTRENGVFKTDIEKLKVVYHAPLFSEPNNLVYPGIYFELDSPFPTSWDKANKLENIVIPIISRKSDQLNSLSNTYFVSGQKKSEVPIRSVSHIQNIFVDLIKNHVLLELFPINYYEFLNPNITSIILKKLPLMGFKWNNPVYRYENSGISKESDFWDQIAYTFTNGIDWFINHSTFGLESTFFNSFNIITSLLELLKKELFSYSRKIEFFQDPALLPNIFLKEGVIELLNQNYIDISGDKIDIHENLEKICKIYISETGGISYLYNELSSNTSNSGNDSDSRDICKQMIRIWEPNFPFLIPKIRKIFLMEFLRRIKQEDARLGSNLIWPTTSTSFLTSEWHSFSRKSVMYNFEKVNSFVGFYNFHYFWDPALVLNILISEANSLNIYFDMDFTQNTILEISQTPMIELGSWVSLFHSPLYTTHKLITSDTIKKLFISHISSKRSIDIEKAKKIDINFKHITTLYNYCYDWLMRTQTINKNEIKSTCRDIEGKYGKTVIYLHSLAHNYELISGALLNLVEKHPHSDYNLHTEMQKVYRTKEVISKSLNDALYNSQVPETIKIRALNIKVETVIYYDQNMVNYSFFQFVPPEMLNDLNKNDLFVYSKWFFLNDNVINSAFNEALIYLQLKSTKRISMNINLNTNLIKLESNCLDWLNQYPDSIIVLNPEKEPVNKMSIPILKYPRGYKGVFTLDINTSDGKNAKKVICETFIDLITVNYNLFSGNSKDRFYTEFNHNINTAPKSVFNDKIIGWYLITKIVNLWSKELFCCFGINIFSNIILKISTKNLDQLAQYSLNDFTKETGIDNINFFFNYATLIKMATDSAYELGYLLVTKYIPEKEIVSSKVDKLKIEIIKKKCISAFKIPEIKSKLTLIKLDTQINGNSERLNFNEAIEKICDHVVFNNKKMFINFVESKSNRKRNIEDLYNRIRAINVETDSTSFSFIEDNAVIFRNS